MNFLVNSLFILYTQVVKGAEREVAAMPAAAQKDNQNNMLAQNAILATALTQNTAKQLPPQEMGQFVKNAGPNGENLNCDPHGTEGNWAMVTRDLKKECIKKAEEKKRTNLKLIKELNNPSQECTTKVSKESIVCHTRKVLDKLVTNPVYKISTYGNVVDLTANGESILYAVIENFNYNVTKKSQPVPETLKDPSVQIEFNELGGLLSQKGELPPAKPDEDPCAACLSKLSKSNNSLDGAVDDCHKNCDSKMLYDFAKEGHFRKTEEPQTDEKQPKPETEASPEGEDEAAPAA